MDINTGQIVIGFWLGIGIALGWAVVNVAITLLKKLLAMTQKG